VPKIGQKAATEHGAAPTAKRSQSKNGKANKRRGGNSQYPPKLALATPFTAWVNSI